MSKKLAFVAYNQIALPSHLDTAICAATPLEADCYIASQRALQVSQPGWHGRQADTKCYVTGTSFIAVHRDAKADGLIIIEHHAVAMTLDDVSTLVHKHTREISISFTP